MGANTVNPGDKVQLTSLDALYNRLSTLKNTHINSTHQINKANLTTMPDSSNLSIGTSVNTEKLTILKQELANLAKSQWYKSNTAGTVVTMTDFSNFTIPSPNSLLLASDFNLIESAITSAEAIVPNYSGKYSSDYSSDYFGHYVNHYSSQYSGQYYPKYTYNEFN